MVNFHSNSSNSDIRRLTDMQSAQRTARVKPLAYRYNVQAYKRPALSGTSKRTSACYAQVHVRVGIPKQQGVCEVCKIEPCKPGVDYQDFLRRTSWAEAVAKNEKKRFEEHKREGGQIRF